MARVVGPELGDVAERLGEQGAGKVDVGGGNVPVEDFGRGVGGGVVVVCPK